MLFRAVDVFVYDELQKWGYGVRDFGNTTGLAGHM
jgi:hypothetical protein